MKLAPSDPRHGTTNGYTNLGCRCDACRAAATKRHREGGYQRRYTARLRERLGDRCHTEGCPNKPDLASTTGYCKRHNVLFRHTRPRQAPTPEAEVPESLHGWLRELPVAEVKARVEHLERAAYEVAVTEAKAMRRDAGLLRWFLSEHGRLFKDDRDPTPAAEAGITQTQSGGEHGPV